MTAEHAGAQDRWVQIPNTTQSLVWVDTLSAGDGPWHQRKVWIRREHPYPIGIGVWSDKALYVFNCERSTFAVKSVINYKFPGAIGSPVSSTLLSDEQLKFTDVVPGSVSEGLFALACRRPR